MMQKLRFILISLLLVTTVWALPLPKQLIALDSPQGRELLATSQAQQDFLGLMSYFVTQESQAYCGVASSVVALNALGVAAPLSPVFAPYRLFTQDNFFNAEVLKITRPQVVNMRGMTLAELAGALKKLNVSVQLGYAEETNLPQFRKLVVSVLRNKNRALIVNFHRSSLGQPGAGHLSPIAAYNQKQDRVLVLDVSRYKYPPYWAKLEDLWRGMEKIDNDSKRSRGFLVISNPAD